MKKYKISTMVKIGKDHDFKDENVFVAFLKLREKMRNDTDELVKGRNDLFLFAEKQVAGFMELATENMTLVHMMKYFTVRQKKFKKLDILKFDEMFERLDKRIAHEVQMALAYMRMQRKVDPKKFNVTKVIAEPGEMRIKRIVFKYADLLMDLAEVCQDAACYFDKEANGFVIEFSFTMEAGAKMLRKYCK